MLSTHVANQRLPCVTSRLQHRGALCWGAGGDQGVAAQFSSVIWAVFPAATFKIKRTSAGGFVGHLHVFGTVPAWVSGFRSRCSSR